MIGLNHFLPSISAERARPSYRDLAGPGGSLKEAAGPAYFRLVMKRSRDIQSLYSTNVCHIYSSHICIPLHIEKKELHRDNFIHTGVFISSHRFFKGTIWEGISGGLSY